MGQRCMMWKTEKVNEKRVKNFCFKDRTAILKLYTVLVKKNHLFICLNFIQNFSFSLLYYCELIGFMHPVEYHTKYLLNPSPLPSVIIALVPAGN